MVLTLPENEHADPDQPQPVNFVALRVIEESSFRFPNYGVVTSAGLEELNSDIPRVDSIIAVPSVALLELSEDAGKIQAERYVACNTRFVTQH